LNDFLVNKYESPYLQAIKKEKKKKTRVFKKKTYKVRKKDFIKKKKKGAKKYGLTGHQGMTRI